MRPLYLSAILVLVLDQVSKFAVVHWLDLKMRGSIDVLPPILNFRMAWNAGINFGLFSGNSDVMRWVLIAIALAISLAVFVWIARDEPGRWARISAGVLIGGALGNVIDRMIYGAVADFLNMSCCGIHNPFAFNVADVAIFAGAIGLIFFTGRPKAA